MYFIQWTISSLWIQILHNAVERKLTQKLYLNVYLTHGAVYCINTNSVDCVKMFIYIVFIHTECRQLMKVITKRFAEMYAFVLACSPFHRAVSKFSSKTANSRIKVRFVGIRILKFYCICCSPFCLNGRQCWHNFMNCSFCEHSYDIFGVKLLSAKVCAFVVTSNVRLLYYDQISCRIYELISGRRPAIWISPCPTTLYWVNHIGNRFEHEQNTHEQATVLPSRSAVVGMFTFHYVENLSDTNECGKLKFAKYERKNI